MTSSVRRLTREDLKALLTKRPFDREAWEATCHERLHLRIGNARPRTSRAIALDELEGFLARVDGFGRDFCEVWSRGETLYAETDVQFINVHGNVDRIPCAILARSSKGALIDLRFHLDPTPIP